MVLISSSESMRSGGGVEAVGRSGMSSDDPSQDSPPAWKGSATIGVSWGRG